MVTLQKIRHYLLNCFLLLIPILVWNIIFTPYLPESITDIQNWENVPNLLLWLESFSRLIVFVLPAFMPLQIKTRGQKTGLVLYIIGLSVYLFAWRQIILYPHGAWASSLIGFTSLAYTPLIMLTAIGLIGRRLFFELPYHRLIYFVSVLTFILFHTWHTILVFQMIK